MSPSVRTEREGGEMKEEGMSEINRLRIFQVRGQSVVLDGDLAMLYGLETGQFNRAMKRNAARFPTDFVFQLTKDEWTALRCQIGSLDEGGRGRHRKYLPNVFTEHGAIMAATVLNSPRAVAMSVYVVRAFVRLRSELLANTTLEKRLAHIEKTLIAHDLALRDVFERIRPLLVSPPEQPRRRIGFHTESE
jgi:hypothetical protein